MERECPECGATEFRLIARTSLHLGEKAKFRCPECEYGFVRINGAVDTGTA